MITRIQNSVNVKMKYHVTTLRLKSKNYDILNPNYEIKQYNSHTKSY